MMNSEEALEVVEQILPPGTLTSVKVVMFHHYWNVQLINSIFVCFGLPFKLQNQLIQLRIGESSKVNVESGDDCNSKEIPHQSRTHVGSTKLRMQQIYFLERRLF